MLLYFYHTQFIWGHSPHFWGTSPAFTHYDPVFSTVFFHYLFLRHFIEFPLPDPTTNPLHDSQFTILIQHIGLPYTIALKISFPAINHNHLSSDETNQINIANSREGKLGIDFIDSNSNFIDSNINKDKKSIYKTLLHNAKTLLLSSNLFRSP